jgi:hypothetical protein
VDFSLKQRKGRSGGEMWGPHSMCGGEGEAQRGVGKKGVGGPDERGHRACALRGPRATDDSRRPTRRARGAHAGKEQGRAPASGGRVPLAHGPGDAAAVGRG